MKKVIVAGAGGFIGKHLVKALLNKEYSVTALDIKFDDELLTSVRCISMLNKTMDQLALELDEDYDCFYDLAWAGTSGSMRADYNIQLDNVKLTCDFICLVSNISCKRVVYASSINEMETYEYLQSDNIEPSGGYIYGTGKLAAHLMAETVAYQKNVNFIPVIITNIYGKGEKSARLIYSSIVKLLKNEHCSFTEGWQIYDFVYISDAINSIIEVAEKGTPFNRYYIGSGNPKPLREFLLKVKEIVSPEAELGLGDILFRGISIDYNQFDMKKVENDTGYKNKVSFEEGIRLTAEYIKGEMEYDNKI